MISAPSIVGWDLMEGEPGTIDLGACQPGQNIIVHCSVSHVDIHMLVGRNRFDDRGKNLGDWLELAGPCLFVVGP